MSRRPTPRLGPNGRTPCPILWAARVALAVGIAVAAAACHPLDADVEIAGAIAWGECTPADPWTPPFAALVQTTDASWVLRFASGAAPLADDDYLMVAFSDASLLQTGVPITVQGRTESLAQPVAWGVLALADQCPDERARAADLQGTVTFTRLERRRGGTIAGTLSLQATDNRDPQRVLAPRLDGEFAFEWKDFPPFTLFF